MLNDDKVTSVRFLKDKVLATRISQEKKFEPYFRVPIKYPINLQDYVLGSFGMWYAIVEVGEGGQ